MTTPREYRRIASGLAVLAGLSGCNNGGASDGGDSSSDPPNTVSYDDESCSVDDGELLSPTSVNPRALVELGDAEASISLDVNGPAYRLADGCTLLEMRRVHPMTFLGEGGLYGFSDGEAGLPYVRTHGGWLEILHSVTLYSHGSLIQIENQGCTSVTMSCGDCIFHQVASCPLRITTTPGRPRALLPTATASELVIHSRYDAIAGTRWDSQFLSLRELGFAIGNIDWNANPPLPMGLNVGIDFVTPFGVSNLDLAYFNQPVIGATFEADTGPHHLSTTILDLGNVNTHCYTGSCIDIFDLDLHADVADPTPRIPAVINYQ